MKLLIPLFLTAFVWGCATPEPIRPTTLFDSAEAKHALRQGDNNIRGSAIIRQQGGGTVTCAGSAVGLIPATAYANDIFYQMHGSLERGFLHVADFRDYESVDPEFWRHGRKTTCDAQGFFKFDNLSDGTYFISTEIIWKPTQHLFSGGNLMRSVTLSGGDSVEIVLAP